MKKNRPKMSRAPAKSSRTPVKVSPAKLGELRTAYDRITLLQIDLDEATVKARSMVAKVAMEMKRPIQTTQICLACGYVHKVGTRCEECQKD